MENRRSNDQKRDAWDNSSAGSHGLRCRADDPRGVGGNLGGGSHRLTDQRQECFDGLSMNGEFDDFKEPLVLSSGSGRALSESKDKRTVFHEPAKGLSAMRCVKESKLFI